MNTALKERRQAAHKINNVLGKDPKVTSVYVFGSVATRDADERSDLDITFICQPDILPVSDRIEILSRIGRNWEFDSATLDNPIRGAVDIGLVDGIPVEVHYQTAPLISQVLDEVVNEGAISTATVPFRPYTVAGLIQRAWLLRDKDREFQTWLEQTKVYPQSLKLNLLRHFIPILRQTAEEFKYHAERRLGPHGCLFFLTQAADALTSILFALNEVYDPADRRQEHNILPALEHAPEDFCSRLQYVLEGPFDHPGAVERAHLFDRLAAEVLAIGSRGEACLAPTVVSNTSFAGT